MSGEPSDLLRWSDSSSWLWDRLKGRRLITSPFSDPLSSRCFTLFDALTGAGPWHVLWLELDLWQEDVKQTFLPTLIGICFFYVAIWSPLRLPSHSPKSVTDTHWGLCKQQVFGKWCISQDQIIAFVADGLWSFLSFSNIDLNTAFWVSAAVWRFVKWKTLSFLGTFIAHGLVSIKTNKLNQLFFVYVIELPY